MNHKIPVMKEDDKVDNKSQKNNQSPKSIATRKAGDDGKSTISHNPMSVDSMNHVQNLSQFGEYIKQESPEMWISIKGNSDKLPAIKPSLLQQEGKFLRISSGKDGDKLREMYLEGYNHYLFCYKCKGSTPSAWLDILFTKIKIISNTDVINCKIAPYYGVRVIKQHKYDDIVCKNQDKVDNQIEYFKRHAVQSQFANYYTQIDGLGAGKFAKVFKVERDKDKHEFAVKVYDTKKLFKEDQTFWVLYEIAILRSINNDRNLHCLKLQYLYEGRNYIYCVNDLYRGGELIDAIANKDSQSEYESLKMIRTILKGLAYQASINVVHRDIKAPNIVLRDKGEIFDCVQVDFGFAIKLEDIDRKNKKLAYCVGTPGYVAPEMLRGLPYDCKADVFSTGCTLYLMMHYSPVFYSKDKDEVLKMNRACDIDLNFNNWPGYNYFYSNEVLDLLAKMLAKDPSNRYTAQQCLDHPAFWVVDIIDKIKSGELDPENAIKEHAVNQNTPDLEERVRTCDMEIPRLESKEHQIDLKTYHIKQASSANKVEDNVDMPDNIDEFESPNMSPCVRARQNVIDNNNGNGANLFDEMSKDVAKFSQTESGKLKPLNPLNQGQNSGRMTMNVEIPKRGLDNESDASDFSPGFSPTKSPGKNPSCPQRQSSPGFMYGDKNTFEPGQQDAPMFALTMMKGIDENEEDEYEKQKLGATEGNKKYVPPRVNDSISFEQPVKYVAPLKCVPEIIDGQGKNQKLPKLKSYDAYDDGVNFFLYKNRLTMIAIVIELAILVRLIVMEKVTRNAILWEIL